MAKTKISEYSSTANSNTDIASINIDEGCAPSGINNAIRALMAQLKDFQTGAASDPVTVGGVLTVTGGSASAPAITTSGDTNTGVLFPAADTVGITTGGSERVRVDSSGNVGVGVTPSSWGGGYKAIQNLKSSWFGTTSRDANFGANVYVDAVGYKYIDSSYATLYTQYNGAHSWSTAASGTAGNAITFTQAMTLDASGNLAIGTTSSLSSAYRITSAGGRIAVTGNSDGLNIYMRYDAGTAGAFIGSPAANVLAFSDSNGTERARIDSSGNLLVGTTTAGFTNSNSMYFYPSLGASVNQHASGTGSGTNYQYFIYNAGIIGSISQNGTTAVAYNTSSDYRLKENIQPMTGALEKVAQLNPVTYTWKADGSAGQGFIAHELQAVVPDCVTGEKDAVDENGNPEYQGIDTSFLVATLTAAIQEQQAIIQQLQADVAALKGN